jgi:hypothetical protein
MPFTGAELERLEQLAARLDQTGNTIGTTRTGATQAGDTVVAQVRDASGQANARVIAELETLRADVQSARDVAEATQWTGTNAEVFRGAYAEFTAAMERAEISTNQIFDEFKAATDQLSQSLEDHVRRFDAAMIQAEESARTMGQVVRAQRDNLDQAMNTGMTVV